MDQVSNTFDIRSVSGPTRWKPGESGNLKGRPRFKPITDAIERILENPKECEKLAKKLVSKAKGGSIHHLRELMDRVEGKVIQQIEHTGNIVHEITDSEKVAALSSLQKIQALSSTCETPLLAEDVSEE